MMEVVRVIKVRRRRVRRGRGFILKISVEVWDLILLEGYL